MERIIHYFIVSVFFVLFCVSCAATTEVRRSQAKSEIQEVIRIMPLGDSITKGSGSGVRDKDFQVSYRKALWDKLKNAEYKVDFVGSQIHGSAIPDFDPDHEGHGGWSDNEVAAHVLDLLRANPADVVLLHIGTNGLNPDPDDVENILDNIDLHSEKIWVILGLIINRMNHACPNYSLTTSFNENVAAMALDRITNGDKIIVVDMECGANIDYRKYPFGDMWDRFHPYDTGYVKMADIWFSALEEILPKKADTSSD